MFYENTVSDATERGVFEAFSAVTYNIRNSTIVDNDGGGIYVHNAGATTNIYSCIIQDNTSQNDIHEDADGTTNVYHTIYNTLSGDFETSTLNETTDATFTNSATDDYTLAAASNGIDEGYTVGSPALDLLGATRDGTPDMGCYEFGAAAPLPISLISFQGEKNSSYNNLLWTTASEKNNDYFSIEKTIDGVNFENIGNVKGAENSIYSNSYKLTDNNIESILNYYRLVQTDFDGKKTYSNLISIDNRIEEQKNKKLLRITNTWGQEIKDDYKGVVIYIYSDGSIERKFKY